MLRRPSAAMAEGSHRPSVMYFIYSLAVCLTSVHRARGLPWSEEKLHHQALTLTEDEIRTAVSHTDVGQMWSRYLKPLLVTRYPGSPGSLAVQEHIKTTLSSLGAGWEITEDKFVSGTPYGRLPFNNIIATLDPSAKRRLVLACHHDSKYYSPQWQREFHGATDSAVPCAMMLELAQALDEDLKAQKASSPDLTLQLIFFDGEEALFRWTASDSLYGSRHLARKMETTPHPAGSTDTNLLHGIVHSLSLLWPKPAQISVIWGDRRLDLFVLLDLIGAPSPHFGSYFADTVRWLMRLQDIEKRLHSMNQLLDHPNIVEYFWPDRPMAQIQDDHVPFLNRGVHVLHLIPSPFPSVWHTFDDNEQNLDRATIQNLNKILQVFVLEYLNARPTVATSPQNFGQKDPI